MNLFQGYRLEKGSDGYTVILYLNSCSTEFADELSQFNEKKDGELYTTIKNYININFSNYKITAVKVMLGSLLLASLPFATEAVFAADTITPTEITQNQAVSTSTGTYTVVPGDSLWSIALKNNTTIDTIKTLNNLTSDTLLVGQVLILPAPTPAPPPAPVSPSVTAAGTSYTVEAGDTLWKISLKFKTTVDVIKAANNLSTNTLSIGQALTIPSTALTPEPTPAPAPTPTTGNTYTVVAGDTLWAIAMKFNTTIADLKATSNLTSDALSIGQVLTIPAVTPPPAPTPVPAPAPVPAPISEVTTVALPDNIPAELIGEAPTITYSNYTVVAGDNTWNISIKFGIPAVELLRANNLTENSIINIGQVLKIPVHNVPVQPTMGAQYGEYLDWWTEAQYVFSIGKIAKITDLKTQQTFMIKRTIGAVHADCEPLTAADAAIMKESWGGAYSWSVHPIIVEVDGKKIAAATYSMPHDIEYLLDNNFPGHFCIHFLNSTRHKDNLVDPIMQEQIKTSAGLASL